MTLLTINTPTEAVEIHETPSGAYAVTNDRGRGLMGHNFFTLDDAAVAGLQIILAQVNYANSL